MDEEEFGILTSKYTVAECSASLPWNLDCDSVCRECLKVREETESDEQVHYKDAAFTYASNTLLPKHTHPTRRLQEPLT